MEKVEILKLLREMTDDARYNHTLGVVEFARELAGVYGVDHRQAEAAALLHDCARCLSPRDLLATAEGQGLPVDELERAVPELLHGKVGAFFARTRFGVDDRAVLRAIELHTLGAREMTQLDKIIFIADMIEPGRDFPGVEALREVARRELDLALLKCFDSTIRYVMEKQQYIHPQSIDARNAVLLKLHKQAGT
ncbi:MAG: bis(5'-nucleosyl)-tetraphosphatase (symmetrical) YqeK [Bacillota bacterium]